MFSLEDKKRRKFISGALHISVKGLSKKDVDDFYKKNNW